MCLHSHSIQDNGSYPGERLIRDKLLMHVGDLGTQFDVLKM